MINKNMDENKDQPVDPKPVVLDEGTNKLADDTVIGHAMDHFVITDRTNSKELRNRRG